MLLYISWYQELWLDFFGEGLVKILIVKLIIGFLIVSRDYLHHRQVCWVVFLFLGSFLKLGISILWCFIIISKRRMKMDGEINVRKV